MGFILITAESPKYTFPRIRTPPDASHFTSYRNMINMLCIIQDRRAQLSLHTLQVYRFLASPAQIRVSLALS